MAHCLTFSSRAQTHNVAPSALFVLLHQHSQRKQCICSVYLFGVHIFETSVDKGNHVYVVITNFLVIHSFINSVLRPLLWVANLPLHFSFQLLSLSRRIFSSLLDHRPMFALVSIFLVCLPVFLLLLTAEYHNVQICFSLCSPHKTTLCFVM